MTLAALRSALLLLALPLALWMAASGSGTAQSSSESLAAFLQRMGAPQEAASLMSDRMLARKCQGLEGVARRSRALSSLEASGSAGEQNETALAGFMVECLLSGSPANIPANVAEEIEALRQDFQYGALADFPALQGESRQALIAPFAQGLAPSARGVSSDWGRDYAMGSILVWQRAAILSGSLYALDSSIAMARDLHERSLRSAKARRAKWFKAESDDPAGVRMASESPSFRGSPAPDPERPFSSKTLPRLEALWGSYWDATHPLARYKLDEPPAGQAPEQAALIRAARAESVQRRSRSKDAFEITSRDDREAEKKELWRSEAPKPKETETPETPLSTPLNWMMP